MPRPIHFEIHTDNPDRTIGFYSGLFGWKFTKWEGPMPYWLIATGEGPGIDGGMHPRQGAKPVKDQAVIAWVCTVDVPTLDQYVTKAQKLGGKDVVPKMAIPGIGWLAYCTDTDGNIFGMLQNDPGAK